MERQAAYWKAVEALEGRGFSGQVVTDLTNAIMSGGNKTVFTDTRQRIEVRNGEVIITPVDPHSPT